MAETNAIIGKGTLFAKEVTAGSNTYEDIEGAEITSINFGGFTVDILDATHMESPTRFREWVQGLLDGGEISFDFNWIPQADEVLISELTAGISKSYRITWPNGIQWTFDGFATGFTPTAPVGELISGSFTYKITGAITPTPAAS